MNTIRFQCKINGLDPYDRMKVIVDDPQIITKKIDDIKNPYSYREDGKLECYLSTNTRRKQYFLEMAESHKGFYMYVTVTIKKYSFDGKQGTSLILKSMEF